MLSKPEFATLLLHTGVPVEFREAKPPNRSVALRAIVQSIPKNDEPLINAYGVGGASIQFPVDSVPEAPVKFDSVTITGGKKYVIETVVPQYVRGTGDLAYYLCFSKG